MTNDDKVTSRFPVKFGSGSGQANRNRTKPGPLRPSQVPPEVQVNIKPPPLRKYAVYIGIQ